MLSHVFLLLKFLSTNCKIMETMAGHLKSAGRPHASRGPRFRQQCLNPSLLLSLDSQLLSPILNCIVFIVFCSFCSSTPCTAQCVLFVLHNKEYTYLLI